MQASASASSPSGRQDVSGDEKPTLQEVVEKIGLGPAHIRYCLTGGGVYLADGAELLLITAVTGSVADVWSLGHFERGITVTIVFIGVLIGNLICGPLGDRFGRRHLIISSYIGIFIFSILSSFASNYFIFSFFRLFVGFSFGIGQPAWNALLTEVTPCYWRIAMNGLSQTLFAAGEIYSASLILADNPDLQNLHWRRLLQLGAIPSALFAFASAIFLLPSPSFLALHGQPEAAKEVLDAMKADNYGDDSIRTDFKVVAPLRMSRREFGYQIKAIFSRDLRSSTLILGFTCSGLNVVYYGCLYAFPRILPELQGGGSAGLQLLLGALCEIPGNMIAVAFGMMLPRKPVLKLYLLLMSLSLAMFVFGTTTTPTWFTQGIYHVGYYGIKVVSCIGYVVAYQYAGEIYPTEARATGTSFCIGSGRLGATLAPLIFEGIQKFLHSFAAFFYFLCIFCVINVVLIDFLPYETSDTLIRERLADDGSDGTESYGSVRDEENARAQSVHSSTTRPKDVAGDEENEHESKIDPHLDDGCMGA